MVYDILFFLDFAPLSNFLLLCFLKKGAEQASETSRLIKNQSMEKVQKKLKLNCQMFLNDKGRGACRDRCA
jgi:hypothetical protein